MSACVHADPQAVARQSAEAVSVRLGALLGRPQAQLEGFKSRALRGEARTQRDLYATEWCSVPEAEGSAHGTHVIGDVSLAAAHKHSSSRASRHELTANVGAGKWAAVAVAVATQRAESERRSLCALEVALVLVQAQAVIAPSPTLWLLTLQGQPCRTVAVAAHAGLWGMGRSVRAEASLPLVTMQAP